MSKKLLPGKSNLIQIGSIQFNQETEDSSYAGEWYTGTILTQLTNTNPSNAHN